MKFTIAQQLGDVPLCYCLAKYLFVPGIIKVSDGQFSMFEHNGQPFCRVYQSNRMIEAVANYDNFFPDDVIVFTYPKAGRRYNLFRWIMVLLFDLEITT